MNKLIYVALIGTVLSQLGGCAAVVVGGAATACKTLGELPLVEIASRMSPGWPNALTCRANTWS